MEKTEILQKAMEKAVNNGVKKMTLNVDPIIFSHDFAKAFFGEETKLAALITLRGVVKPAEEIPHWKIHLQEMVIAEEPLEYLKQFL